MKLKSVFVLGLLLCAGSANASGLGEQLKSIGPWNILKKQDAMTDKISCIAIYGSNTQVQLSDTSLAIGLKGRGGVSSYQIRLDNQPAGEMQLPSDVEKDIGAAFIEDDNFSKLLQAKRVRFQALTALSTFVNEDWDFTDAAAVVSFLKSAECNT